MQPSEPNTKAVLYIHGKGGSAAESEHYKPLFPNSDVIGLDYRTATPWETGKEICEAVEQLRQTYDDLTLIANSIGAFFCLHAGIDRRIRRAYFLSPVVDMEAMILSMLRQTGQTEDDLRRRGELPAPFGETLSWAYLCYVRAHPVHWSAPTRILCGGKDTLVPCETVRTFAEKNRAELTVMETAAHWFHTPEELRFADRWILAPWEA